MSVFWYTKRRCTCSLYFYVISCRHRTVPLTRCCRSPIDTVHKRNNLPFADVLDPRFAITESWQVPNYSRAPIGLIQSRAQQQTSGNFAAD